VLVAEITEDDSRVCLVVHCVLQDKLLNHLW
jgi:hypothetical protein